MPKSNGRATWVATLSNGQTVYEKDQELIPGERKPWVKLTEYLASDNLHVTSLRLNLDGRTIHLPRLNFDRFDLNEVSRAPISYSLCYHAEGEMSLVIGEIIQTDFIELSAHYEDFVVSYIQDISDGNNSWIVVTDERRVLAETPRRR